MIHIHNAYSSQSLDQDDPREAWEDDCWKSPIHRLQCVQDILRIVNFAGKHFKKKVWQYCQQGPSLGQAREYQPADRKLEQ